MIIRAVRIGVIIISFLFLTGFLPFLSLLGPSYTMFSTGSLYKAGAQFYINKSIEDKTGKGMHVSRKGTRESAQSEAQTGPRPLRAKKLGSEKFRR